MVCKNFNILDGCNKCKYSLMNYKDISLLSSLSIIDVIDQLIVECNASKSNEIALQSSTITCTGNIDIVYNKRVSINNSNYNRSIIYEIINAWLKYNKTYVQDTINIIYLLVCASILVRNEDEHKAVSLLDDMQKLFTYIQSYANRL